jgi:uroporphyrinogen III methyltransferase / synthase
VLLARANRGRQLLRDELASRAAQFEQVVAYDQVDAVDPNPTALDGLRRGEIRYVTLPSANIARAVLQTFDETIRGRIERGEVHLVAISPETGGAIRERGYRVAAEAAVYTEDGLIDAVVRLARRQT